MREAVMANWKRYGLIVVFSGVLVALAFSGSVMGYSPEESTLDELSGGSVYAGEEIRVNVSGNANLSSSSSVFFVRETDGSGYTTEGEYVQTDNVTEVIGTDGLSTGSAYGFSPVSNPSENQVSGVFTLLESSFSAEWESETVSKDQRTTFSIDTNQPGEFPLTIIASGLSYEELEALFGSNAEITEDESDIPFEQLGYNPETTSPTTVIEDGYITLVNWETEEGLEANFRNLNEEYRVAEGDYNFEFFAVNTKRSDSASVTVESEVVNANFQQEVVENPAGDLAEFSVGAENADEIFLQIGSSEKGFVDFLYVKLADSEEDVRVTVNTRLLGTNPSLDTADVYDVENAETVVSAYHNGNTAPFNGSASHNGIPIFGSSDEELTSYNEYLQNTDRSATSRTDQLLRPLQPTTYPLYATATPPLTESESVFNADSGEPTAMLASSILRLSDPTLSEPTVYAAPAGDANTASTSEDILDVASERSEIAEGDRLVIKFEATGIYGGIVAGAKNGEAKSIDFNRESGQIDPQILSDYIETEPGVYMSIKSTGETGNQDPTEVNISAGGSHTTSFVDADAGEIYVVVDTSATNAFSGDNEPSDPGSFTAEMTYTAQNTDSRFQFSSGGDPSSGAFMVGDHYKNYPYYEIGERTQQDVEFDISQPSVSFSNVNRNRKIEVTQSESAIIPGESNVAPGSDASLYLRTKGDEDFFVTDQGIGIGGQNGRFEAEVDFTDQPLEQEFIVQYRVNDQIVDTAEGIVVDELSDNLGEVEEFNQTEDPLTEENSTDGDNETVGGEQDNNSTRDDAPTNGEGTNTTDQKPAAVKVPGFTPVHAVLALLLGSVLIAVRSV